MVRYKSCQNSPGRVVDILEACGAFDPGSSPGRDAIYLNLKISFSSLFQIKNLNKQSVNPYIKTTNN